MTYFPYVTLTSDISTNDITTPAFFVEWTHFVVQNKTIVAARFVVVSDNDGNAFSEQQENENTKKKMLHGYDLTIFREFLRTCDEKREIEDIMPMELHVQAIIKKFVLAVWKKKEMSMSPCLSEKYQPLSLKNNYEMDSLFLSTRYFKEELQTIIKKFVFDVQKNKKLMSTSPRLSELFSKLSTAIFKKITMDSLFLIMTTNSTKYNIF